MSCCNYEPLPVRFVTNNRQFAVLFLEMFSSALFRATRLFLQQFCKGISRESHHANYIRRKLLFKNISQN